MDFNKVEQEQQVLDTMLLMGQKVESTYVFPKIQLLNRLIWLKSEIDELEQAININDLKEFIDAIEDIRTVLNGYYVDTGINYNLGREAYDIITKSNQSKICESPKDLKDTVIFYRELQTSFKIRLMYPKDFPSVDVYREHIRQLGIELNDTFVIEEIEFTHNLKYLPYYVIVDAVNNKYLKNVNYTKVDLSNILDKVVRNSMFSSDTTSTLKFLNVDSYGLQIINLLTSFENYLNANKDLINNTYTKEALDYHNEIKRYLNKYTTISELESNIEDFGLFCDTVTSLEETFKNIKIINNVK